MSKSYSVLKRENPDQNNSEYGHFLRSDWHVPVKKRFPMFSGGIEVDQWLKTG